jgi:hypothetical protein
MVQAAGASISLSQRERVGVRAPSHHIQRFAVSP